MTPALVASTAFTISMIVSPTVAINIDGKNITLPIPEHSTYTVNKEIMKEREWRNFKHYKLVAAK